jgi:hypothetical protein
VCKIWSGAFRINLITQIYYGLFFCGVMSSNRDLELSPASDRSADKF